MIDQIKKKKHQCVCIQVIPSATVLKRFDKVLYNENKNKYCFTLTLHLSLINIFCFYVCTGSIASEYSDVGRIADEDRCCREHDLCPHTLAPGIQQFWRIIRSIKVFKVFVCYCNQYMLCIKKTIDFSIFFVFVLIGECKRGLCNQQKFTRSHCDCDAKFRRCLQGLNTGNW